VEPLPGSLSASIEPDAFQRFISQWKGPALRRSVHGNEPCRLSRNGQKYGRSSFAIPIPVSDTEAIAKPLFVSSLTLTKRRRIFSRKQSAAFWPNGVVRKFLTILSECRDLIYPLFVLAHQGVRILQ
jgi:hypothetical protein